MFRILMVLAVLLPVLPAFGQQDPAACASIAGATQRLACYDAIFPPAAQDNAASSIVIQSEQQVPARPSGRAPAEMTVACSADELSVGFRFAGAQLSATGVNVPLTFLVDQGGNTVRNLPVSSDNTEAFVAPGDSAAFLDTISAANNLRVRVTPNRQRSLTVDFRVGERNVEIAALRDACG